MLKLGIVLIVLPSIAFAMAFIAAIFGFAGLAELAYDIAKIGMVLLVLPGIILLAIGLSRRKAGPAA